MYLFMIIFLSLIVDIQLYSQTQQDDDNENYPDIRYDVHRQYNEDGDLIFYDSVSVSTWNYDTSMADTDSLPDIWEFGTPNHFHPFHYGFHFPSDRFRYIPDIEFDFIIPDLHDFGQGFEYNYSITPPDSLDSPLYPEYPVFRHQHVMPPADWDMDINEQIYRMEKFIEEFNQRMERELNEPYYYNEPAPSPNDSTESPDSQPEPFYNSYNGNPVNI